MQDSKLENQEEREGTGSQRAGDDCGRERDTEQDAGLESKEQQRMTERWSTTKNRDREQDREMKQ